MARVSKNIMINERMAFHKCRTNNQCCVYCGKYMEKGEIAISMNNKGDNLVVRKNLWIHIPCGMKISGLIEREFKKKRGELLLREL